MEVKEFIPQTHANQLIVVDEQSSRAQAFEEIKEKGLALWPRN